jgi:hypothetical protein
MSNENPPSHFLQRFPDTLQYEGKSQEMQITPLKYGFSVEQGVRVLSISGRFPPSSFQLRTLEKFV